MREEDDGKKGGHCEHLARDVGSQKGRREEGDCGEVSEVKLSGLVWSAEYTPKDAHVLISTHVNILCYLAGRIKIEDGIKVVDHLTLR